METAQKTVYYFYFNIQKCQCQFIRAIHLNFLASLKEKCYIVNEIRNKHSLQMYFIKQSNRPQGVDLKKCIEDHPWVKV